MKDWVVLAPAPHGRGDGIGDYAFYLMQALNTAHPTRLAGPDTDWTAFAEGPGVVFLQYSPPRAGSPNARTLVRCVQRARAAGRSVVVTIHEYWPPPNGSWRRWLYRRYLRRTLSRVLHDASAVVVTQEVSARELREAGVLGSLPVSVVPVGSNIERVTASPMPERTAGLVIFGQPAAMDRETVVRVAAWIAASDPVTRLTWLGRSSEEMRAWWTAYAGAPSDRVTFAGGQPADQISRQLAGATLGLAPYADGASTRRTTLAALLQHGVPTVALSGVATDGWLAGSPGLAWETTPDAFVARVTDLLADARRRHVLSGDAEALYARHMSWPQIKRAYLAIVGGPGAGAPA